MPTFNIFRILIFVFALVMAFPYLPGAGSPAFQGVSIFVGVLFSLGSTSAVANVVAGIVITYMRAFKIGDRVQIADTEGIVIERSLFVTRLRTTKNVEIAVPNSKVLANHIVNYSVMARKKGVYLHTSVGIGYDVNWRRVHELLIAAAAETDGIADDWEPFVQQKELGDFAVVYELNAPTRQPHRLPAITSELHANILDQFHQAGVEIMSPDYTALRRGNRAAIPAAEAD
jgi:small-conductance mechanosensitive channel